MLQLMFETFVRYPDWSLSVMCTYEMLLIKLSRILYILMPHRSFIRSHKSEGQLQLIFIVASTSCKMIYTRTSRFLAKNAETV